MKLSILQTVLGALIVGSFFLFIEYIVPGYYYEVIIDTNGNVIGRVLGLHKPNVLLNVWSLVYPALGLAVFGCGVAQCVQTKRKTTNGMLTLIQVILGVLIVASLVVFIVWVEPHFEPYTRLIDNSTKEVVVQKDPHWIVQMISWKATSFILGLSVLGCDLVQFLKGKRRENKGEGLT